jgi:hypothetical protein
MIFRFDAKLAGKIKVAPLKALPANPNPYADWTARLFTASRVQYILMTNTRSLYSVVMPGKGVSADALFLHAAMDAMTAFLRADGNAFIFKRFIAPEAGAAVFSKTLNRSVTGSMNDLVFQTKVDLIHFGYSLHEISSRLNETPMSYLGYGHPREVFMTMMMHAESRNTFH